MWSKHDGVACTFLDGTGCCFKWSKKERRFAFVMKFGTPVVVLALLLLAVASSSGFVLPAPHVTTTRHVLRTPSYTVKHPGNSSTTRLCQARRFHFTTFRKKKLRLSKKNRKPAQRQLKQAWSDLRYGFLYIHNNFLDIAWNGFSRFYLVKGIVISMLMLVHSTASPEFYAQFIGALTSGVKALAIVPHFYQKFCFLFLVSPLLILLLWYYVLGNWLPAKLAILLKKSGYTLAAERLNWWRENLLRHSHLGNVAAGRTVRSSTVRGEASNLSRYATIVVFVPLLEELLYRFMFDRMQRFLCKIFQKSKGKVDASSFDNTLATTKRPAPPPARTKLWFGRYRIWALLSSLLFAASHISNWYDANKWGKGLLGISDSLSLESRFISATTQFTLILFLSLSVFSPLYEKAGFAASLGGHVAWNFFMLTGGSFHVLIRLVRRATRHLSKRIKKNK